MNTEHVEKSLDKIRKIFQRASSIIEGLKPGERLPATKLSNQMAEEFGIIPTLMYPTLMFLFRDYPGVKLHHGKKGGFEKLSV